MQTVYFYFDDSGTFHKNEPSGYFYMRAMCFAMSMIETLQNANILTPIKRFAKRQAKQVS